MSEDIIDTKLKEDVKKVFEKNSDNIQYVHDVLLPDQKLNIKVEYNQEVVYKKLLQSKKAAQIALNLYNANEIYRNLKILTELDLKNPCENENPEDNNDSDLENSCEKESSNNSCCKKSKAINELDSDNLHSETPSDDHDHVGEQESSLPNSHNEDPPIGESFCVDKRDKSEVIDKLYQYVFYFLIARNLEIIKIYKTTVDKERSGNLKCQICETDILPTDLECSNCKESLLTIYEKEIDKYEKSKIEEIKITKNRDTDSVTNKEVINRDDNKHKTNTNRNTDSVANKEGINRDDNKHKTNTNRNTDSVANKEGINRDDNKHKTNTNRDTDSVANKEVINSDDNKHDKESGSQLAGKHDEVNLDGIKWKCKHCGVVNEDEYVNCTVCMEARAEWNCRKCTFANEISSEKCKICEELRENRADNNDWICWFGECKKRNGGNELYCTYCGLDKSANRERGAAVDIMRYGKIEQVWICYACNIINYELYRSLCGKCYEFKFDGKDGSIKKDNKKNFEKDGRTESWICWYGGCKKRNGGNELYCTYCGLDKSVNRQRGATVEMSKFGKIEQVWICCACDHINYDLNKSICDKCYRSKCNVKGESDNGKDKMIDDYVMIQSDNVVIPSDNVVIPSDNVVIQSDNVVIERDEDNNKWKCSKCQCGNDRESLSCKQCQSPRIEMWSCKHCTMRNQIWNDYCAACGEVNVNKTIKYCSKCKHSEIICDDLCGDCLNARDETWTCWYRFCKNRNVGNEKYCKHCGLDRYADKINIGKPMLRCKGDGTDQIWICVRCSHINDISRYYYCQNSSCRGENKYTKWCYKCGYKYNYESSKYCEICVQKL